MYTVHKVNCSLTFDTDYVCTSCDLIQLYDVCIVLLFISNNWNGTLH